MDHRIGKYVFSNGEASLAFRSSNLRRVVWKLLPSCYNFLTEQKLFGYNYRSVQSLRNDLPQQEVGERLSLPFYR